MKKVSDILARKGNYVESVSPETIVIEALRLMADKNVSAVLVMENDKLTGIFTERDYARKIILKGKTSADSKIREVMVSSLITITPDNDINDCMKLMTNKTIRHLPVMDGDTLVGLVSIGDVVKSIIEEQQDVIQHLEQYIAGA